MEFDENALPTVAWFVEIGRLVNEETARKLRLECFELYFKSSSMKMMEHGIQYLIHCFRNCDSQLFLNALMLFYQRMYPQIVNEMENKIDKEESLAFLQNYIKFHVKNRHNKNFEYLELSQILQINIFVKKIESPDKVKFYCIENSPFSLFIVENSKERIFLKPFNMNFDWTIDRSLSGFQTSVENLKKSLNIIEKKKCRSCEKNTRQCFCLNFHMFCFDCLKSFSCKKCSQDKDENLIFFNCLKISEEVENQKDEEILCHDFQQCDLCGKNPVTGKNKCDLCMSIKF
jgi:hypothetical protein